MLASDLNKRSPSADGRARGSLIVWNATVLVEMINVIIENMKCPVDKEVMKTNQAHGITIDLCQQCLGVWFEHDELKKITDKFVFGDFKEFEKWKDIAIKNEPSLNFWKEPVRTCPQDYSEMKRHTFAGDSKIHIDRCEICGGFWLDGDDIKRLMEYLKPNKVEEFIGRTLINEKKEFERITREIAELPFKLVNIVRSPSYFIYLVLSGIVNLIKDDIEAGK